MPLTPQRIFETCPHIAVVGLSPRPERASHRVAQVMQTAGYHLIPINPNLPPGVTDILGQKVYASLTEAAQHERIDLVNCFRRSELILPIVHETLTIQAKALWLQLGIVNNEAMARADAVGLLTVQDKCWKIEYMQWHHSELASKTTI